MPVIRGLLFDLGSTLWQKAPDDSWYALERPANARAGALLREQLCSDETTPIDHQADDAILGAVLRKAITEATKRAHRETPDDEADFVRLSQQALEMLLGRPVERTLSMLVFEALRVRSLNSRVLFADTLPTLAELRTRGYVMGVVTNRDYGGEIFMEDLRQMGLLAFFASPAIAISADLGMRKPNPRLFHHALAGLRLDPAEVAMIGDNLIADVWGAQRVGLLAIWKPSAKYRALAREARATDSDADLVRWAQQQAHAKDPRTITMALPDAMITHLSDLLSIFPEISELQRKALP